MEEKGRQIFSKIVRASKLTRQRTLIHGELTERSEALLFFSELGGNSNFRRFLLIVDVKALPCLKIL